MKLVPAIFFILLTLVSCAPSKEAPVSALFPQTELAQDFGCDYITVDSRRSFADKIDYDNSYTYAEPLPDRYQFALNTPIGISNFPLTPVYSFVSTGGVPNGLVQVMFHGVTNDASLCLSALNLINGDFVAAYGQPRPMYGFEDTLSEFFAKPTEEQTKILSGDGRVTLNGYWTVKDNFTSEPRVDLIVKVSLSCDSVSESGERNYILDICYQLTEVKDWKKDWMENSENK